MKLTIQKKLIGGFGLMVACAALLGIIGWTSLDRVTSESRKSETAGQLLQMASQGRQLERSYAAKPSPETLERAAALVAEFQDATERLVGLLQEPEQQAKVRDCMSAVANWHQSLQQFAAIEGNMVEAGALLAQQAHAVQTEVVTILADQNAKLRSERAEARVAADDRNWKSSTSLAIQSQNNEARIAQLKFQLTGEMQFAESTRAQVDAVVEKAAELETRFFEEGDKELARKVQTYAKRYLTAFDRWVATQIGIADAANAAARTIVEDIRTLRDIQGKRMQEAIDAEHETPALTQCYQATSNCGRLVEMIMTSGMLRRDFMLEPSPDKKQRLHAIVDDLRKLTESTMPLMDPADAPQADTVLASLTEYRAQFDAYAEKRAVQDQIAANMVEEADALNQACTTIYADQQKKLSNAREQAEAKLQSRIQLCLDSYRLTHEILTARIAEMEFVASHDEAAIADLDEHLGALLELSQSLKDRFVDPTNDAQMDRILAATDSYSSAFHEHFVKAVGEQASEEAKMAEAAADLEAQSTSMRDEFQRQMESTSAQASTSLTALASISILIGLFLSFVVTRSVLSGINRIIVRLRDIAEGEGDLTARVDTKSGDELAVLAGWFNTFVENIQTLVTDIRRTTKSLLHGATQIASASDGQASAATEQAASLQEMSSALHELTSHIKETADNAADANRLSTEAKGSSDEGSTEMANLSTAIGDIKQSSNEMASIIDVIDGLAFQTNLLALNAAVEAARAGDAGKGFAVVAEEVRSLAQRSAEAARKTSELIQESVARVDHGVTIGEKVDAALTSITKVSQSVNGLLENISAASNEQSRNLESISGSMRQMDQSTQSTAGSSEELAAIAGESRRTVEGLDETVGRFQVTES